MKWFNKLWRRFVHSQQPKYRARCSDDVPEYFEKNTVYIIGEQHSPWLAAFECPCGCNTAIELNLLKETKPRWKVQILKHRTVDIAPSIWRTTGCRSHFIMRQGRIKWF